MYYRKQDNADGSATIRLIAGDTTSANVNIDLRPQGSGKFLVNGPTELTDVNFFLADDQNPDKRAKFEISNVTTGAGIRTFSLPNTGSFTSTTLIGNDTAQTITNKTIIIEDNNLQIVGSSDSGKIARFETDAWESPVTHIYRLPDYGTTASQSTLIDTITEQDVSNKNLINPTVSDIASGDPNNPTPKMTLDASPLTSDRTVSFPDQSFVIAGADATQTFTNKNYADPYFVNGADTSARIFIDATNVTGATTLRYEFPATALNTNILANNTLVAEDATQVLTNKSIVALKLIDETDDQRQVFLDLSNIEGTKTIQFPNADATLLSTENVGTLGVSFGGPISGPDLGGRLRLQQHFAAGW